MIPSMGLLNTLAVLQAWVSVNELHGIPESSIGWIFSLYAFFLYLCGAQVGPIFDAHDVRFLIIPGCIGIVAATMLLSLAKEYYQFLLTFGVLGGVSASMLFNPSIATIGHWFSERRALATGMACTAGGVGGVVFPLIILYASPAIGFPWAIRIIGFICAAASVAACTLLRKRLPPNKKGGSSIDLGALRDTRYAIVTAAVFLVEFAVFIPYTYISSYAIATGLEPHKAYLLNTLLNAGAIPGRALPGYVADRFGVFNVMCVTCFTCVAFILCLWLTTPRDNEAMVTSFAVLYGFWSGAAISLTPVCIGQVCRVEDYGKRNGTAFSIASIGALVGIPLAGAILQAQGGGYSGVIALAGGAYAAATAAFIVARGVSAGWSLKTVF
ncbi:hypothetical protein JX265_006723 [Neoarthrinium moseri]|uniref:Major facilitator superfamily (MFS) profile domain-containing protein n=1 Tax=Neoarthrinium moseri TaxID=1658444 RepID=A0A9P9WKP6_9PEZI|nr:hypothetical protein JX266_006958 [Neoarthrinium moseri]KAI1868744.1 hypothetical protein JX265_006723 [Neoarthrinium moseri]